MLRLRERLLEELFKVALDKGINVHVGTVYALEMVEFDEHLVKYALKIVFASTVE